jgi:ABC-type bacteriocin/lantibiotic exporter with double-glycine peptidase domain
VTPQTPPQTPKKRSSERLRELWPDIKELIRPRRAMLATGFLMMAIGTPCGLVLPASTKYLVDDVIGKKQLHLLIPLVMVVLAATVIRGITSYALTQIVSKAGQRLIAELRQKVQTHVAHLPVSYYDANKTGTLVARIMNDVEGIRNLLGTGLIEFVGGVLTAFLV